MTCLIVTMPDGHTWRHEVGAAGVHIGRSGRNDVVLEDPTVSRMHAEIVRRSDGFCLVDLGGRSGTFVNGRPVRSPVVLHRGDHVRMGRTSILFEGEGDTPVEIADTPIPRGSSTRALTPEEVRQSDAPTPAPSASGTTQRSASALLRLVVEADREMTFHRPIEEIFDAIIDLARRAIGFERAALMLLEGDRLVQRAVRVPAQETARPITISSTIVDRVLFLQESLLIFDAQLEDPFRGHDSIVDARVRSVMCAPLRDEHKVIGLLYVDSCRAAGLFTEDDLRVLAHLASVAAVRIEHARLFDEAVRAKVIEDELRQAAAIQDGLLPAEFPAIPGYEVHGMSVPCHNVGGDCFDFLPLPDGRQVIQLGDVAGKGLPAALLMCCFHSTLRAVAATRGEAPGAIRELNRLLHPRFPPNRFVTCFFAILDPRSHRLTYVNAGQDPPFLIPARGEPRALSDTGLPLGLVEDFEYQGGEIGFDRGDVLLCYSDGATEGVNPHGEMFGTSRLVTTAALAREHSSREIVSRLTRAIELHYAGASHEDDITLVVVKRSA